MVWVERRPAGMWWTVVSRNLEDSPSAIRQSSPLPFWLSPASKSVRGGRGGAPGLAGPESPEPDIRPANHRGDHWPRRLQCAVQAQEIQEGRALAGLDSKLSRGHSLGLEPQQ